ncbi:hypothetical protein [Spiroplasma floricola]|uniref:ABC transporter permease n=1 Tax=Spiroplasma floricola 23-6 TaxID=1336749 RepID=A0A2K8SEE4_9MOLU|nr:hypothetical protein [Spiroplasma floricola]AUB31783.1 ABC transporter permease [Spiroplasma floricola 23-6]
MKKKSISIFTMFKIDFKLIFFDKASGIIAFISLVLSVLFGFTFLLIKNIGQFVIYYNYYFLFISGIIWIILIMRLVFLFMYSKIEDKTIYIISTQSISRSKIFLVQTSTLFLYVVFAILMNFSIINIFALIFGWEDKVIINMTLVHMIYLFFISYALINFFSLLSICFKNQITTIIITLILSLSFIASLPYQFIISSEKNRNLYFTSTLGNTYVEKIDEIYKAFDFQQRVTNKKIKYKHLSNYLNNFFISNKFSKESTQWTSQTTLNSRFNFWDSLGVINTSKWTIKGNNLTVSKLPTNWGDTCQPSEQKKCIQLGDSVNLSIFQNSRFISMDNMKTLISAQTDSEKKLILTDLYDFTNSLLNYYSNSKSFQKQYYKLYGDLLNFETGEISLVSDPSVKADFSKAYLIDSYKLHFVDGINSVGFIRDSNANELYNDILYDPLYIAIRVLEEYFINYTSSYVNLTNYTLDTSRSEWWEYKRARDIYNIAFYLNPLANMFSVYTRYAGESWEDNWFAINSDSYIDLTWQKNLFLSYSSYIFKLDENNKIKPDTYNNFVEPYYFLIVHLTIAIINNIICLNIYKKKDFV